MRPVVVTNCTTRKRGTEPPLRLSPAVGRQSLRKLSKHWQALLAGARRTTTAGELYVGRSIAESKRTASLLGADLYFVSAGVGLVHESEPVPNYDLTVSSDAGALQEALHLGREPLTTWWALLG